MDDGDPFEDFYDPETIAALDQGLRADDLDGLDDAEPGPMLPSRVSRWGRTAALGMVFTGFALGIQEVLDPREAHPIVIEVDSTGEPAHLPIELFLDPDSPSGSICLVRRTALPTPEV